MKIPSKTSVLSFIAGLSLLANISHASLITYADRATFDAANPGLAIEDFQDIGVIGDALSGTNITPGVAFALTSGTNAYLANPGQSSNPTQAIGVNVPRSAGWNISFTTPVNAVGVDVFQNNGGGAQFGFTIFATVDVYGVSGLLGSFLAAIPSGSAGFAGVYSTSDLITSVVVNNVDSFDVIDNVEFGLSSSVPDQGATLALLGLALAAIVAVRRKVA